MRKKISPGLIATSGDGKPSIHPRVPAHWGGQASSSSTNDKDHMKPSHTTNPESVDINSTVAVNMEDSSNQPQDKSFLGDSSMSSTDQQHTSSYGNLQNSSENSSINDVENRNLSDPLPSSHSSQVSSENLLEKRMSTFLPEGENIGDPKTICSSPQTDQTAVSLTTEKDDGISLNQSLDNGSARSACDDQALNQRGCVVDGVPEENVNVMDEDSTNLSSNKAAPKNQSSKTVLNTDPNALVAGVLNPSNNEESKEVDLVSMTIASVAAGEGDPPQCSLMPENYRDNSNHQQLSIPSSGPGKSSKLFYHFFFTITIIWY